MAAPPPGPRKRELARADRLRPGVWRLRLPLPYPGVPHVNSYAIAAGNGIVLVDTGLAEPGALAQLELALHGAGLRLEHVRLLVCTHAHPDHYGLAGPILDAAGCELWMHPAHAHITRAVEEPARALERRIEVGRHSGVPEETLEAYRMERSEGGSGVDRVVLPDRELAAGMEVETDLGTFVVHETPGHAPSHVVLHDPRSGLLISGDHLLGRVSLFLDYGHTPDPTGEFLRSLDTVEALGAGLCIAGHGRPFRDVQAHIEANRAEVADQLDRVRDALAAGPRTPFELVPVLLGSPSADAVRPGLAGWMLNQALAYLRHLELHEEARLVEGSDPERWEPAPAAARAAPVRRASRRPGA